MSITPIITIEEADVFLDAYSDWLDLEDSEKTTHIYNASLYIQTVWTCTDVDYEDDTSIPEEVKNACALYALADSVGNLYGTVETADTRRTTREMVKAGSVTVDETFSSSGKLQTGISSSFGLPNALMSVYCTSSAATRTLLRD